MEKKKMPSKTNPLRATPDQGSKGCCCGSTSKKQEASAVEPLSRDASVATSVESDSAIDPQTGGCCGAC